MKKYLIGLGIIILVFILYTGCARQMERLNPFDPGNTIPTSGGGGGGGGSSDTYTKLLLHMDGVNGSSAFADSSSYGRAVTATGATVSTVQRKFGGASGSFGTSGGKYLAIPYSSDFVFGSGDFTIDFWYCPLVHGGSYNLQCTNTQDESHTGWQVLMTDGIALKFAYSTTGIGWAPNVTGSYTFTNSTWYHIAVVRSGNGIFLFVNGTVLNPGGTAISGSIFDPGYQLVIGQYIGYSSSSTYGANSYIDEFRISKGVARWTSNFTPPTSAY